MASASDAPPVAIDGTGNMPRMKTTATSMFTPGQQTRNSEAESLPG